MKVCTQCSVVTGVKTAKETLIKGRFPNSILRFVGVSARFCAIERFNQRFPNQVTVLVAIDCQPSLAVAKCKQASMFRATGDAVDAHRLLAHEFVD